jgi:hypothetical protein
MGISVVKNPSMKTTNMIHHSTNVTRETGFIDGHFCGENAIDENNKYDTSLFQRDVRDRFHRWAFLW